MGFLTSIKKLFGIGETGDQNNQFSKSEEVTEVEVLNIEEPKTEVVETLPTEESVSTKVETVEEEPKTVKEIKSKARSPKENSLPSETRTDKPKKPYRRPRPKKDKPS